MKNDSRYPEFGFAFRKFLESKRYESPSDFHRDLTLLMGNRAPAVSTVWGAFYGVCKLPMDTVLFMIERFNFKIHWDQTLPVTRGDIEFKTAQMSLPGMRDIKNERRRERWKRLG